MSTPRLPRSGEDGGTWGEILNEFLLVAHNPDGSAKSTSSSSDVSSVNGQTGAVTLTKSDVSLSNVDNTSDANKPVSVAMQNSLNLKANTSTLSPVATSGQYADLINKPTVPDSSSLVFLSGAQQINGEKDFIGSLKSSGEEVVTVDDARLTNTRTPTDGSVSSDKILNGSVTEPKLDIANAPSSGNFLGWDGTSFEWRDQEFSAVTSVSGQTGAITLTKSDVGLSNADNTSDANKPVSTAVQTQLDLKVASNDSRLTNQRTPSDNSVTAAKIQDDVITEPKLAISNTPASGNVLAWDGTDLKWEAPGSAPVSSVSGRTGAVTLAKADVGLDDVDNTTDAAKPVSSATQTALNAKLAKSGDTMTGALTLPGDPTNPKHATTKEYVDGQLGNAQNLVIGTSAPTPANGVKVLWLNTTGGNVTLNLVTGE